MLVCGGCFLGCLSENPEKAGTLQEKESQWLLGRLGKSELIQVALANEREMKSRASVPALSRNRRSRQSHTGREKSRWTICFPKGNAQPPWAPFPTVFMVTGSRLRKIFNPGFRQPCGNRGFGFPEPKKMGRLLNRPH